MMYDILYYNGAVQISQKGGPAMGCLKCGKKTAEEQSFCPDCLEAMDAYPVKSDVHIQLPNQADSPVPKKTSRRRRAMSAEEQTAGLRRRIRQLTALTVILLVLLAAIAALLIQGWITTGELKLPIFDCFT